MVFSADESTVRISSVVTGIRRAIRMRSQFIIEPSAMQDWGGEINEKDRFCHGENMQSFFSISYIPGKNDTK